MDSIKTGELHWSMSTQSPSIWRNQDVSNIMALFLKLTKFPLTYTFHAKMFFFLLLWLHVDSSKIYFLVIYFFTHGRIWVLLIVENHTVTAKYKTSIQAPYLKFVSKCIVLDSHSWSFTSMSFLTTQLYLTSDWHVFSLAKNIPVFNDTPLNLTYYIGETATLKCSVSHLGSSKVSTNRLYITHFQLTITDLFIS